MNSKNKGNTFERKIANLLSARFKEKTGLEKSFRRNADSGSFFGGTNNIRVTTHDTEKANFGDIITPGDFSFTIECKHYKDPPSFSALMKQDWKTLDKWLEQAEIDSVSSGKNFVIIMKFNNVNEVAVLKSSVYGRQSAINYKEYVLIDLNLFLEEADEFFFE